MVVDEALTDNVVVDDLLADLSIDVAVDHRGHVGDDDLHSGFRVTQSHAAGLTDQHMRNVFGVEFIDNRVERLFRTGGDAAGAHADDDLRVLVGGVALLDRLLFLVTQFA